MTPWEGLDKSYGPHVRSPHAWQVRGLPIILDAIEAGAPMVHACTGAGKSLLLAEVCRVVVDRLPPRGIVVVSTSRNDLVDQLTRTFAQRLGRDKVGRYDKSGKRIRKVTVACIDSLERCASAILDAGLTVELWVADEAHNVTSERQWSAVALMSPRMRLGVTATPYRRGMAGSRPAALAGWDESPAVEYRIADAERDGVLVPVLPVLPSLDLDGAKEDDALIAMIRASTSGPGIVSAHGIQDAIAYAERLTSEGIPAAPYHAGTPRPERVRLIRRLIAGQLRCLVHPLALTEGVDIRELTWCGLRAMRGPLDLAQEVGRVARACPETGKRYAVALDPHRQLEFVGREHDANLIESLQEWEARETEKRRAAREVAELEREQARVAAVSRQTNVIRQYAALAAARGWVDLPRPGEWRFWVVTSEQRRALSDRSGSTRWLPEPLRSAVRECMVSPDLLDRGAAVDALSLLDAARREASKAYRASGNWSSWRWPADLSPIVLEGVPACGAGLGSQDRGRHE